MSSSSSKIVVLKCSEGDTFEVDAKFALQSHMIKQLFEYRFEDDECADTLVVPLPDVSSVILSKIIELVCEGKVKINLHLSWRLICVDSGATNYLNIKGLWELPCQTVAEMMKSSSPNKIREIFHIRNDFTREEEEAVRRENPFFIE
nr:hypothetical protein [Tanacetum cinerariifolium]